MYVNIDTSVLCGSIGIVAVLQSRTCRDRRRRWWSHRSRVHALSLRTRAFSTTRAATCARLTVGADQDPDKLAQMGDE